MTGVVDPANRLGIKIWGSSIGVKAKRVVAGDKECWGSDQDKHLISKLVPEVGIPSIFSGQAPRHGVEALRDFESGAHPLH